MRFERLLFVICLTVFPAVYGCGQTPAGQEKTVRFTVSGFNLPAVMAFTEKPAERAKAPTISDSQSAAETFVRRLIMGTIEDVLYQQGRSAFLSDDVISLILQQLQVQINYEPLKCENVIDKSLMGMQNIQTMVNCVIIDGTVTSICMGTMMDHCNNMVAMNLKPIPSKHFSISGSLKTSNVVMANWSNQMWENVLNRALRSIISGPNGSYFHGASVNIQ